MTDAEKDGRLGCFGVRKDGLGRSRVAGAARAGLARAGGDGIPAVQGPAAAAAGPVWDGVPGGGAGGGKERGGAAGGLPRRRDGGKPGGFQPAPSGGRGHRAGRRHRLGCAVPGAEAGIGAGTVAARGGTGPGDGPPAPPAGALAEPAGRDRRSDPGGHGRADPRPGGDGRGDLAIGGDGGRRLGGRSHGHALFQRGAGGASPAALAGRRGEGRRVPAVGIYAVGAGAALAAGGAVRGQRTDPTARGQRGAGGRRRRRGVAGRRGGPANHGADGGGRCGGAALRRTVPARSGGLRQRCDALRGVAAERAAPMADLRRGVVAAGRPHASGVGAVFFPPGGARAGPLRPPEAGGAPTAGLRGAPQGAGGGLWRAGGGLCRAHRAAGRPCAGAAAEG